MNKINKKTITFFLERLIHLGIYVWVFSLPWQARLLVKSRFVNNEFWGVYNLRERLGQHYLKYNFGADIDKSNLLQGYDSEDHGSNKKYKSLLRFLESNDPTNPTIFDSINMIIRINDKFYSSSFFETFFYEDFLVLLKISLVFIPIFY